MAGRRSVESTVLDTPDIAELLLYGAIITWVIAAIFLRLVNDYMGRYTRAVFYNIF